MNAKENNKAHYERLLKNGSVELRCFDKSGKIKSNKSGMVIWSGLYDNWDSIRESLIFAEKEGFDVYNTINPTKAPASNEQLKPFLRATRDADISRIKTLFFDFDPDEKDENGCSNEDAQIALDLAAELVTFLYGYGWSVPTIAYSGNGAHVLYAVDLDVSMAKNFHGLYAGLARRFNKNGITFDVSVKNPARICRAYGTTNHKGNNKSECVFSGLETDGETIAQTINDLTPPKKRRTWVNTEKETPKTGKYIKNLDIAGLFSKHGLYLEPSTETGKHFVECPWSAEHTTNNATSTVIWEGEWSQFHCSHAHCAGRSVSDVIQLFGERK